MEPKKVRYLIHAGIHLLALASIFFTALTDLNNWDAIALVMVMVIVVYSFIYWRAFMNTEVDNKLYKYSFISNYVNLLVIAQVFKIVFFPDSNNPFGEGFGLIFVLFPLWCLLTLLSLVLFLIGYFRNKKISN